MKIILIIYRYMESDVYKYNKLEDLLIDWEVKNIKELKEIYQCEIWKGKEIK